MLKYFNKIYPIVKKEMRQIKRDPRTIILLIFFPAFLLVLLGYAINFDVKNANTLICDESRSLESRKLIEAFSHNEYFSIVNVISDRNGIDQYLNTGGVKAAIIIPADFSRKIKNNHSVTIPIIIDGSDSNTGGVLTNYIALVFQNYSEKLLISLSEKRGQHLQPPVEMKSIVWYNPDLKTAKFLIPGLIAFILMIVATVSTALSIVREKERGNMEQLYVSPVSAFEIIAGKIIPYLIFGIIASTLVLLFSILLFDITIKGSILWLYLIIFLFIVGALGMGLFVSAISESTQVAFMIATFSTMLPTFLLSGFIFPVKNMPVVLQIISYIVPAKYFIFALRTLLLKGAGIEAFWEQVLFLIFFAFLMFSLSTIKFVRGRIK